MKHTKQKTAAKKGPGAGRTSPRKGRATRRPEAPQAPEARGGKSVPQEAARPEQPLEVQLIGCLPHAVIVLEEGNRIAFVNPAAELFFGSSRAVMMRQTLDEVLGFDSPVLALASQIRGGQQVSVNEYGVELATPKTGGLRHVDVHVCRLPEGAGQLMVVLQERNMAQMIERQLTHRGAVKSVTALGAMLAHEIKNPLSGIKGAAQLLEPDLSDADRELTQLICSETDRICALVDRMDMFSENVDLECEPQNIHEILNHVVQLASRGFASHIRFKKLYDPSLPPVPGNRDKLVQIYLNLVKNAAEALGNERIDGEIIINTAFRPGIRMSLPGGKAAVSLPIDISIIDNGPGIAEEIRPHIFEPFVTSKFSGSGLGLALTAKLINDLGGILDCESRPGRTRFVTLLPKADV